MNNNVEYKISYNNMKKIIENYFSAQGKNVKVKINSSIDDDRFAGTVQTYISIDEKINIAGIESNATKNLFTEDLKEIISLSLEDNQELVDLTDSASVSSCFEGYGMDEHQVQKISDKYFTATVKTKSKALH